MRALDKPQHPLSTSSRGDPLVLPLDLELLRDVVRAYVDRTSARYFMENAPVTRKHVALVIPALNAEGRTLLSLPVNICPSCSAIHTRTHYLCYACMLGNTHTKSVSRSAKRRM